jgi:5'-AMP-activated protein kinase catalytic alpha subunit
LFPKTCEEGTNIIDLDAIQEVCEKFGVSEAEVQEALLINDRHDQLVIAYHLILDNKRIWNEGLWERFFWEFYFDKFKFSSKS